MSISAISAAGSFEMPRQTTDKNVKVEPVQVAPTKVPVTETQPVMASNGSEAGNNGQEQQEEKNINRMKHAVNQANNTLKQRQSRTKCEFSYHEATKRVSIKIMDEETGDVIREIPPQETLEMVEKMWELAGILVDERR